MWSVAVCASHLAVSSNAGVARNAMGRSHLPCIYRATHHLHIVCCGEQAAFLGNRLPGTMPIPVVIGNGSESAVVAGEKQAVDSLHYLSFCLTHSSMIQVVLAIFMFSFHLTLGERDRIMYRKQSFLC